MPVEKELTQQQKNAAYKSGKNAKHKGWSDTNPFMDDRLYKYFIAGYYNQPMPMEK